MNISIPFVANLQGGLILQGYTQEQIDYLKEFKVFEGKINKFQREIKNHKQKFSLCKTSRDKNRWEKKYSALKLEFSALLKRKQEYKLRLNELQGGITS